MCMRYKLPLLSNCLLKGTSYINIVQSLYKCLEQIKMKKLTKKSLNELAIIMPMEAALPHTIFMIRLPRKWIKARPPATH